MTKRALIVIDVQNEYFTDALPIAYPDRETTLANIGRAMDAAAAACVAVVLVQHSAPAGSPIFDPATSGWALHPAIAARPRDLVVEKPLASALCRTALPDWLRQHGIDTLAIAGYMTHNCDAATIFQAAHEGYAVEFLHDASGALPYRNRAGAATAEEIHRVFSVVFQSNFAAVLSTDEWIAALASATAPGKDNVLFSNRRARGLLPDEG